MNTEKEEDLHPIERNILYILNDYGGSIDKEELFGLYNKVRPEQIRRGLEWLKFKKRIKIENDWISIII